MKAGGDAMAEMNAGDRAVFQIGGVKDQQVAPVLVADILHREQKAVAFGGLGRARRKHGFAKRIAIRRGEKGRPARRKVQLRDGIEQRLPRGSVGAVSIVEGAAVIHPGPALVQPGELARLKLSTKYAS